MPRCKRYPVAQRKEEMEPVHGQEHPDEREVQRRWPAAEELHCGFPDQEDEDQRG